MYFCYIDEAGCPGTLPSSTSPIQPILAITALFIHQKHIPSITKEFLHLKEHFNPEIASSISNSLDMAKYEVKGSNLRKDIRKQNRNRRRRAFGFLDKTITLLENSNSQIVSNIHIKKPGQNFNGKSIYASSIQKICQHFQHFLEEKKSNGLIIADSRSPVLNSNVAHSIFTQKYKYNGDAYPNILEVPTFGHSENHIPIQITDFLTSSLLYPIASHVYCSGHINNEHVHPKYKLIKERYIIKLKHLSYRYKISTRNLGGITIYDLILKRSTKLLFME